MRKTVRISKYQIRDYTSPLVYLIRIGGVVVYIGLASHGLERLIRSDHKHAAQIRHPNAEWELVICSTESEARDLEEVLIKKHKPSLNVVHNAFGGADRSIETRKLSLKERKKIYRDRHIEKKKKEKSLWLAEVVADHIKKMTSEEKPVVFCSAIERAICD